MWLPPYGIPNEIAQGTGGGSFSDGYAAEFTLLGIKPNYKTMGPHALPVKATHGPVRPAVLRIRAGIPR